MSQVVQVPELQTSAGPVNEAWMPDQVRHDSPSGVIAGLTRNPWLRALVQRVLPWIVPIALITLWQVASSLGWLSTRVLPAPIEVIKAAWTLAASGELWTHVKVSAGRALAGLAIGGSLGLAFGLLTGSLRVAETLLDSSFQMLRNIPALALIPLVILWFGIDETAKLFLVALGVFFPIYINTLHGVRTVDPQLIEMGRIYGMSEREMFRRVIFPGALP